MVLSNRGVSRKSLTWIVVSRLKFVRQSSIFRAKVEGQIFFLKGRIAEMSVLGWSDAFWAVKLGSKHSCEKANRSCQPVLCMYW